MAARAETEGFPSQLRQAKRCRDYGPNPAQGEGKPGICKLGAGPSVAGR